MKNKTNLSFISAFGSFLSFLFLSFPVWSQTTVNFNYTGGAQTFTVPDGVTSIIVDAYGAQGGTNSPSTNINFGGYVQATLTLTPGTVIYVNVGEQPTGLTGGWNGGGNGETGGKGGGGASDIRIGGTTLNDRMVVAGAGGGGGFWAGLEVHGGLGGGLIGGNGWRVDYTSSPGGEGGTQISSGNGTCASFNNPICAGSFGFGGSPTGCGCEVYGGGGGLYGGAGSGNCRGGGGGSSYTDPTATSVTHTQGVRVGHGFVTITYTAISPATGLHFDGADDYVILGGGLNSATNFSTASSFTFEAWVKPDAVAGLHPVFGHRNSGGIANGYCLSIGLVTPGTLAIEASGGTNASSTGTISASTWSHIAYVYDNGTITFYINGVAAGTSSGIIIATSNVSAILGTMSNGFGAYAGSMDEVRIWSRALNACEIQNNLNCELNPMGQTGLIALYQFNQGIVNADNTAINTLTDNSGSSYTGTLANFALTGATSNWTNGNVSSACTTVTSRVTNTNNGLTYCYIQDALNAAAEGDEIILLQNIDGSNLLISNSVILNAGAFTLTARNLTIPSTKYMRWMTNTLTVPTIFSITNNGTLWNNGTIIHTDPYTNAGTYKGTGTFTGNFINNGTVTPGD